MNRKLQSITRAAKSILCILLVLNVNILLTGCDGQSLQLASAGIFRIALTPDHPLAQALRGSPFQDATAMDLLVPQQQFRLIFPDGDKQFQGTYAFVNGEYVVSQLTTRNDGKSATIDVNSSRQITSIVTSDGSQWKRDTAGALATPSNLKGFDAYVAANSDLVAVAKDMDAHPSQNSTGTSSTGSSGIGGSGSSSGSSNQGSSGKNPVTAPGRDVSGQDQSNPVQAVLALMATIWLPLLGILQPLFSLFTVASAVEAAMINRFDGTWEATNASSNLRVVIAGGHITKLTDDASKQDLAISDSKLLDNSGGNVSWDVTAKILGQATDVEFKFDMTEKADGTLTGTLTALGSTFARVPVTMTRVTN